MYIANNHYTTHDNTSNSHIWTVLVTTLDMTPNGMTLTQAYIVHLDGIKPQCPCRIDRCLFQLSYNGTGSLSRIHCIVDHCPYELSSSTWMLSSRNTICSKICTCALMLFCSIRYEIVLKPCSYLFVFLSIWVWKWLNILYLLWSPYVHTLKNYLNLFLFYLNLCHSMPTILKIAHKDTKINYPLEFGPQKYDG